MNYWPSFILAFLYIGLPLYWPSFILAFLYIGLPLYCLRLRRGGPVYVARDGWLEDMQQFQISDLKRKSEFISKQLYGWIEMLKNSNIKGQRHLNDKVKAFSTVEQERRDFLNHLRQVSQSGQKEPSDPEF